MPDRTLVGIPLLIHEGMSVGELRQLARAEAEAEEVGKHIAVPGANGAAISKGLEGERCEEIPRGEMPILLVSWTTRSSTRARAAPGI